MKSKATSLFPELSLAEKSKLANILGLESAPFVFEEYLGETLLRQRIVGFEEADGLPKISYLHPDEGLWVDSLDRKKSLWEMLLPPVMGRLCCPEGKLTSRPGVTLKGWKKLIMFFGLLESRLREVEMACLLFQRKKQRSALWIQNTPSAALKVAVQPEWEELVESMAKGALKNADLGALLGSRSALFYLPLNKEADPSEIAASLKNSLNNPKRCLENHPEEAWGLS